MSFPSRGLVWVKSALQTCREMLKKMLNATVLEEKRVRKLVACRVGVYCIKPSVFTQI